MEWRAEPVFVWFSSVNKVHTFKIKYSIHIGNHPEVKEGDLVAVIDDKIIEK
jgi:ribosomal protein S17